MVVWGTRRKTQQLMTISMNCKNCQRSTVHALRRAQKKFTLYFVPVAPMSTKHYLQCNVCGATSEITKERAAEIQQQQEQAVNANPASGALPGDPLV